MLDFKFIIILYGVVYFDCVEIVCQFVDQRYNDEWWLYFDLFVEGLVEKF